MTSTHTAFGYKRKLIMHTPEISIIVPTYCEADNLRLLIPQIDQLATDTGLDVEIIIVDDNSPDETAEVCEDLAKDFPLRLLVRENERGLSSAVLAGMRLAQGMVLVVMDADLSHPPDKIAALVAALDDPDIDFVIGSRYVAGGGTDENWGLFRYLNSKVATWLARPLTSARDPMAGFFAIRRTTFQQACKQLNPVGYKIGLELIVKCGCRRIAEVPIHFHDRIHGESKLSLGEQINYLRHLKRLYEFRFRNWAYLAQFLTVGATGMVVDLITYATLLLWLPTGWARGLAIWVAMSWNFILNRKLTFAYAGKGALLRRYFGFCASCSLGAAVNWSVSVALTAVFPFMTAHKLVAAFVGIIAGTAFNFVLCRYVVFQSAEAPPVPPEFIASEYPAERDLLPTGERR